MNLPDPSAELAPVDHALALVDVVAGYLADGRTGPARAALAALRVVVEGLGTSEGDSTGASARGKVGA